MIRKKKQTHARKKNFMVLMGISLSLAFLCSGIEASTADNNLIQPLSFNSIVNPHSLIDIDGIAVMCGNTSKGKPGKKTTTDTTKTKVKSDKKTVSDQKNSTSRRKPIID